MIYWINGAYGSGKSTAAECLQRLLPGAHIFDAEAVGNAVRDNYPVSCRHSAVFEDYPLWQDFNYLLLKDLAARFDGDVVVPMTLLRERSFTGVIERLRSDGIPVRYVFLDADPQTLRARILARGEGEDCWCMQSIPMCMQVQREERHALHVDTVGRTPEETARAILAAGEEESL